MASAPNWTPAWDRYAERVRNPPPPGAPAPYSRETDPLFSLDLLDCWERLTGESINANGRVRCPNPDHDDRWPDCSPREHDWRCFACGAVSKAIWDPSGDHVTRLTHNPSLSRSTSRSPVPL